jgi:glycosyltransferase involved in cell wall biosynthesis
MAFGAARDVGCLVRSFHPHLIHAFAATPDGHAALLLGQRYGLPTVCTLIGSDVNTYPLEAKPIRRITIDVLQKTDQVVAVSHALASAAARLAGTPIRVEVVYMGCDPDGFRFDEAARGEVRQRLGIRDEEHLVVSLGYMHEAKGIYDLLDAVVCLSERGQPVHLAFVGWGEAQSTLRAKARTAGMEARVHFEVLPPHEDIPRWLSAADIFALPSHSEGLPLAILEAMACERPVVATRVGGIPEAVVHGETGLLTPERDVSALADALGALVASPERAKAMGLAGRRELERHFTWAHSAQQMHAIYSRSAAGQDALTQQPSRRPVTPRSGKGT